MRVFRPRYRDRTTGQMREAKKFYIDFVDHLQIRHRIPAERCRTKDQARVFGKMIGDLVVARHHGDTPDARLDTWLRGLPKSTLNKLSGIGLIDSRYVVASAPLSRHIADFEAWYRDTAIPGRGRKRTALYVRHMMSALRRLVNECHFRVWSDIDKNRIERWLGRKSETFAPATLNESIVIVKLFCRWMVETKMTRESPIRGLKLVRITRTVKRRPLDTDEVCRLVASTAKQRERGGMGGVERCILYLTAIETGYRYGELRSLRIADFDFDVDRPYAWRTPAVRLAGEFTKNREPAEQALRRDRAEQLRAYFAGRDPEERAFNLPDNTKIARILRADLRAAGIEAENERGKVVFHCFRYVLATALDETGASLRTRMDVMRHSATGNLTLGTYTAETSLIQKRDAVEKLPDYPWPLDAQGEQEKIA